MAIQNIALKAYSSALEAGGGFSTKRQKLAGSDESQKTSFTESIAKSLENVNQMQHEKVRMIESFAAGENENVHELMITLQKAGLAVNMTSAVRNKVMEAYKELMRMPV